MYLQTPRLFIRDYRDEDWMDLFEILSDPVVMEKCEPVYNEIRTKKILHLLRSRNIGFAAVHRESGKVIGHILFCQPLLRTRKVFLNWAGSLTNASGIRAMPMKPAPICWNMASGSWVCPPSKQKP